MKPSLLPAACAALLLCCCSQTSPSTTSSPDHVTNPTAPGSYAVFAWNDLGMHCLNPTYDKAVILPPYNNLVAQVVLRGSPPQLVTSGVTVEYRIDNNTASSTKGTFAQFWTNAVGLFGSIFGITSLAADVGLKGKGLSGTMDVAATGDRFTALGIPVVPIDDGLVWNPYQVAVITVKDTAGTVLVETKCTVPTSDEIDCATCHGTDPFADILTKHDTRNGTSLAASTPVLCASCHDTPALGTTGGSAGLYLSKAVHGFHATVASPPACYDCHPGARTRCSRSTRHTAADGNCTTCHGTLVQVASSVAALPSGGGTRVPWADEPQCVTCHPSVAEVDTGGALYRNSAGHGGLRCAACHGSPHAMVPTNSVGTFTNWDGYQALQYQGYTGVVKSMGSCGVCHDDSRGPGELGGFVEVHGGPNPEQTNGCYACHTAVPSTAERWPHAHQWRNSL
jgi:hypothetical protein